MGERSRTTKPFERDELARLAAASSNKAESRPTSKLTREEILGLVSRTVRPPSHDGTDDALTPLPEPASEKSSTRDALQQIGGVASTPQPSAALDPAEPMTTRATDEVVQPAASPARSDVRSANEPQPTRAPSALPAAELLDEPRPPTTNGASVRPVTARSRLPLFISLGVVATAVVATVLLVL